MSSSFAITTSTYFTISLITSGADLPHFHSSLRKLRSTDTVSFCSRACFTPSSASAAEDSLIAGVMPVTWNQPPPARVFSQSISPGFAIAAELPARS